MCQDELMLYNTETQKDLPNKCVVKLNKKPNQCISWSSRMIPFKINLLHIVAAIDRIIYLLPSIRELWEGEEEQKKGKSVSLYWKKRESDTKLNHRRETTWISGLTARHSQSGFLIDRQHLDVPLWLFCGDSKHNKNVSSMNEKEKHPALSFIPCLPFIAHTQILQGQIPSKYLIPSGCLLPVHTHLLLHWMAFALIVSSPPTSGLHPAHFIYPFVDLSFLPSL